MNRTRGGATLALLAAVLAGCATNISTSEYAALQAVLRTDAQVRQEIIVDCAARIARKPTAERANVAALMGVPVEKVPSRFCRRFFNGVASGKVTADDLSTFRDDDNANLIRVLRGR